MLCRFTWYVWLFCIACCSAFILLRYLVNSVVFKYFFIWLLFTCGVSWIVVWLGCLYCIWFVWIGFVVCFLLLVGFAIVFFVVFRVFGVVDCILVVVFVVVALLAWCCVLMVVWGGLVLIVLLLSWFSIGVYGLLFLCLGYDLGVSDCVMF